MPVYLVCSAAPKLPGGKEFIEELWHMGRFPAAARGNRPMFFMDEDNTVIS